jgi:hypothetical protein
LTPTRASDQTANPFLSGIEFWPHDFPLPAIISPDKFLLLDFIGAPEYRAAVASQLPHERKRNMKGRTGVALALCFIFASSTAIAGQTTLISKSGTRQANAASSDPTVSESGQFVAFSSAATNLVPAKCTNGASHVFVRDRTAGTTTCVSLNTNDQQSNDDSFSPAISSDGQFVAFSSAANDLAAAKCNNGFRQIFIRDRTAGTTTCVSLNTNDQQSNDDSFSPAISSTAQFVAFDSRATNLAASRCNNGFSHVFVRDRGTGTTTCVSVDSNGQQGNGDSFDASVSSDGRLVVFHSSATNLTNQCTNGNSQTFMHNLSTGKTTCISVDSDGNQSDGNSDLPRITPNGLFVVFESDATNLASACNNSFAQIYVHDLTTKKTTCVSMDSHGIQGNSDSFQPSISSDGHLVAFASVATNLTTIQCINGNNHVFVRNRTEKKTTCASGIGRRNTENGDSVSPSISGSGNLVAFESNSTNLVSKDTNGFSDIFAHVLP